MRSDLSFQVTASQVIAMPGAMNTKMYNKSELIHLPKLNPVISYNDALYVFTCQLVDLCA